MGRRKSSQKKVSTKAKKVVSKIFKCPFCAHNKAVQCVMYVFDRNDRRFFLLYKHKKTL